MRIFLKFFSSHSNEGTEEKVQTLENQLADAKGDIFNCSLFTKVIITGRTFRDYLDAGESYCQYSGKERR